MAMAVVAVLSVSPTVRLSGQVSVRLSLGARYATSLVKDSIVVPIDLRPSIAPVLQLTVRDALRGPWAVDGILDLSAAGLKREEGGATADAGSFTAIAFIVGLRREMHAGVAARLGFGGVLYSADQSGLFRRGSGGVHPLFALGGSYAPSFGARHGLEVGISYDLHRFMTPALRTTGFPRPRPVHRIALTVSGRLLGR